MIDEWSGFAGLLANLIEKYASSWMSRTCPLRRFRLRIRTARQQIKKESVFKPEAVAGKIAA